MKRPKLLLLLVLLAVAGMVLSPLRLQRSEQDQELSTRKLPTGNIRTAAPHSANLEQTQSSSSIAKESGTKPRATESNRTVSAPHSISNGMQNKSSTFILNEEFNKAHEDVKRRELHDYQYQFNKILRLPVLRLNSPTEMDVARRIREASVWLKSSVHLVFAATVRNAMRGLPSSAEQMKRLADKFNQTTFVFVENDSSDETRKFLVDWRRRDSRVRLLGCGGSESACRINVSYSTGRAHNQGWAYRRNEDENRERGVVMSALRNIYLTYIYEHLSKPNTLLIVVDADLSFKPWNVDAILQGLYYFKDRPQLHSLCAHTRFRSDVYDTCTLQFFPNKHFSQSAESTIVTNIRSNAATGPPPVKVDSCFQAFTAYRLSHLAQHRLKYGPAGGEMMCEHNTLARQLRENYLDLNMRLDVEKQNEGWL